MPGKGEDPMKSLLEDVQAHMDDNQPDEEEKKEAAKPAEDGAEEEKPE